jgi:hypothetical protein
MGLKANADGSGAIQVGGSDAITITSGLNTTFAGTVQASGVATNLYPLVMRAAQTAPFTDNTRAEFTGIPSWVERITIMFSAVSTSGSSVPIIQLGTGSTSYATSGYVGSAATNTTVINPTAGMGLNGVGNAGYTRYGIVTITNISGNTWVGSGVLGDNGVNINYMGSAISLGAALTAVRVTTVNGTDTFDTGSIINILYE